MMHIDPHTIQMILAKVREQLRCPQCTRQIGPEMDSLKVMSDTFAVMQIQCESCGAHVMLHATVDRVLDEARITTKTSGSQNNVSTDLSFSEEEIQELRGALEASGGSFSQIFAQHTKN